jgi:hypothetical protein
MSELIQKNDNRATVRWKLLTGASALVLTAYASSAVPANAEDSSRPQLWIDLGSQLNRLMDKQETYAPPFVDLTPPGFTPPQSAERPPRYGLDASLGLTFQPKGSDWSFSASIRYGRASSRKLTHHQSYPQAYSSFRKAVYTYGPPPVSAVFPVSPHAARFTDAKVKQSEGWSVLDFKVGKDVGLGLFGRNATSSVEAGVRFAQFTSKSQIALRENPDWQFSAYNATVFIPGNPNRHRPGRYIYLQYVYQPFHSYFGSLEADRSFHGVGPSISWKSSQPFVGNEERGELTFDWGVNAALLFGRQRTTVHHQTTGQYDTGHQFDPNRVTVYQTAATPPARSRSVTVPNVGGFAGISYRYVDFRFNAGYRVDWFFNAVDGGIDAHKSESRGFYGPYASISIGLGG